VVRKAEYRYRKYKGKIDPDVIAGRFDALKAHMDIMVAGEFPKLVEFEMKTKAILTKHGVYSWQFPFYYNVAREMYAKAKKFAGDTLVALAQIIANKWVTRGLNADIVAEIIALFGITIKPVSWY